MSISHDQSSTKPKWLYYAFVLIGFWWILIGFLSIYFPFYLANRLNLTINIFYDLLLKNTPASITFVFGFAYLICGIGTFLRMDERIRWVSVAASLVLLFNAFVVAVSFRFDRVLALVDSAPLLMFFLVAFSVVAPIVCIIFHMKYNK